MLKEGHQQKGGSAGNWEQIARFADSAERSRTAPLVLHITETAGWEKNAQGPGAKMQEKPAQRLINRNPRAAKTV